MNDAFNSPCSFVRSTNYEDPKKQKEMQQID